MTITINNLKSSRNHPFWGYLHVSISTGVLQNLDWQSRGLAEMIIKTKISPDCIIHVNSMHDPLLSYHRRLGNLQFHATYQILTRGLLG